MTLPMPRKLPNVLPVFRAAGQRATAPSWTALLGLFLAVVAVSFGAISWAALRTAPTWWDPDGVNAGSDWHYRVPVTLPSTSTVNSTGKVDINFATLMTELGISGTFDPNSVRVVRPNGTLATRQEFTDAVFGGATDAIGNSRGEVRWIVEDGGTQTYYVYFDIAQNGAKSANPQTPINGNFEFGSSGTQLPPGWNTATKTNAAYDLQIRPNESPTITTDGIRPSTGTGALFNPQTTDGSPRTGAQSFMMGARTNNEPTNGAVSQADATVLTRTFTVPATNPGSLTIRWRVEGWDSDTNNVTTYDHLQVELVGATTTEVVGPLTNAYATWPFAPAYGNNDIASSRSGFGSYNTFDMTTTGAHTLGMTVGNHAQPWWSRTYSLSAYAGQTITLRFSTTHMEEFKSWFHIDDVEWSVVNGTLGSAQAFGVGITSPAASINAGQTLTITARVDAQPTAATNPVTANVYDNTGALVASGVVLYNDGSHGDAVANDAIWTNNGSDGTSPTYTIPTSTPASSGWMVRVFARDGSTSTILAANNGLVHRNALPNPAVMANYWNIDEIAFSVTRGIIAATKTSSVISDPVNAASNPKAIPGAVIEYCIVSTNVGTSPTDAVIVTDNLPSTLTYIPGTLRTGTSCAGATTVEDDDALAADEADPFGASISGTTITGNGGTLTGSATFAVKFRATLNE